MLQLELITSFVVFGTRTCTQVHFFSSHTHTLQLSASTCTHIWNFGSCVLILLSCVLEASLLITQQKFINFHQF